MQGICAHRKKCPSINGGVAFTGIIALLIGGAWATAAAIGSPTHFWLAWISLLPLFSAIRLFSIKSSAFLGGLWGGCLYLFLAASPNWMLDSVATIPMMLVIIPAAYAALMAVFSRRFGYSPLAMALGWILVELAFNLAGLRDGLLSVGNSQGQALQIVADFLGSGFVAFIVIYVNAFLISLPVLLCLTGFSFFENDIQQNSSLVLHSRIDRIFSRFCPDSARPRAPPGKCRCVA